MCFKSDKRLSIGWQNQQNTRSLKAKPTDLEIRKMSLHVTNEGTNMEENKKNPTSG